VRFYRVQAYAQNQRDFFGRHAFHGHLHDFMFPGRKVAVALKLKRVNEKKQYGMKRVPKAEPPANVAQMPADCCGADVKGLSDLFYRTFQLARR
jgi:hypothetical protein